MIPRLASKFLYVSEADTESVVEPAYVADDFAWITAPG